MCRYTIGPNPLRVTKRTRRLFVPGLQAEKIVAAAKAAKTGEEEEEE
jgi:hypothetical protein